MEKQIKTIVISFDGLGTPDFEIMMQKPNFRKFMEKAAFCKQVKTVYPSLTYPAHATIATGKYPKNHGVVHNNLTQINHADNQDWYWYRRYINGKTFYEVAKEKGMTTAAFLWPVAGGADIDYNVPEIFANRAWRNQIVMSLQAGSKWMQIQALFRYVKYLLHGMGQPYLDIFVHKAAMFTMDRYDPDLILLHYCDLDHNRHLHGHDSKEAMDALERHDQRLGDWMKRFEGMDVNWIVLGDHSSLDENKGIRLNRLFAANGLVKLKKNSRRIRTAKVFAKAAGGSCYIYADRKYEEKVRTLLENFSEQHDHCLESVFTSKEAEAMGADPTCLFMVEAKEGYLFQSSAVGPVIVDENHANDRRGERLEKATHGYSPEKPGYTTVFCMRTDRVDPKQTNGPEQTLGPERTKGPKRTLGPLITPTEIENMSLIDEGPSIAHLLGGELPDADGRVLTEFFDQ